MPFINIGHDRRIGGLTWRQRLLIIEVATVALAGRLGATLNYTMVIREGVFCYNNKKCYRLFIISIIYWHF